MKAARAAALFAAAHQIWFDVAGGQQLTCENVTEFGDDILLIGQGRCVDGAGQPATTYSCPAAPCPAMDEPAACALLCDGELECTGFEMRLTTNTSTTATCFIFVNHAPVTGESAQWPWVRTNGTQTGSGVVVASSDAAVNSCCYKKAYPRPNPIDNPVPVPIAQSDLQKEIFANRTVEAAAASAAALPTLSALVDFCANYTTDGTHLFDVTECPGMADVTENGTLAPWPNASQILERFSAEVRAAEYGHGYQTLTSHPNVSNVFNPSYEFLLNLWEPSLLGVPMRFSERARSQSQSNYGLGLNSEDVVQTEIFGCAPFTGPGGAPANFYEARDRIVYTAFNFRRTPLCNTEYFGPFDAVLRPSYVHDKILFTPTDSYKYYTQIPNCTVWPGCIPGTIDYHYHILLSWMALYGSPTYPPAHIGSNCVSQMDMVRQLVCNRPAPTLTPNPPPGACNSEGMYWEADVLGSVRYPEAVKFIVASFDFYFGNETGTDLRNWCIRHKWALAWVLYPNAVCADSRRLLDPVVLPSTTVNVTLSPAYAASFAAQWAVASTAWQTTHSNPGNMTQWQALTNETISPGASDALIWNSGSRECADYDNCLGVRQLNGDCACYVAS